MENLSCAGEGEERDGKCPGCGSASPLHAKGCPSSSLTALPQNECRKCGNHCEQLNQRGWCAECESGTPELSDEGRQKVLSAEGQARVDGIIDQMRWQIGGWFPKTAVVNRVEFQYGHPDYETCVGCDCSRLEHRNGPITSHEFEPSGKFLKHRWPVTEIYMKLYALVRDLEQAKQQLGAVERERDALRLELRAANARIATYLAEQGGTTP